MDDKTYTKKHCEIRRMCCVTRQKGSLREVHNTAVRLQAIKFCNVLSDGTGADVHIWSTCLDEVRS